MELPASDAYVIGAHGAHLPCPVLLALLNVPGAHSSHVVAKEAETDPSAQEAQESLPLLGALVPASQGKQRTAPEPLAKLPGMHG